MEDPKNTDPLLANQSKENEVKTSSTNGLPFKVSIDDEGGRYLELPVKRGRSCTTPTLHSDPGSGDMMTPGGELVNFKQALARQTVSSACQ